MYLGTPIYWSTPLPTLSLGLRSTGTESVSSLVPSVSPFGTPCPRLKMTSQAELKLSQTPGHSGSASGAPKAVCCDTKSPAVNAISQSRTDVAGFADTIESELVRETSAGSILVSNQEEAHYLGKGIKR